MSTSPTNASPRALSLARLAMLAGTFGLLGVGCQDDNQQDIPNRVLDRPTDVALVCANLPDTCGEDCTAEMLAPSACSAESGSCGSSGNHSIGFVANSERNEIAVFARCEGGLVDLNPEVPGYNFIPTGVLPTKLSASADSCRVMSANVGSCDMTLLDAQGLSHYVLEQDNGEKLSPLVDEPSSLVSTVVPQRFLIEDGGDEGGSQSGAWVPLGARPSELVFVPEGASTAPPAPPGTVTEGELCSPLEPGSVYVSFPSCNLVAELDVQTGYILQSRQFVSDGVGGFDIVDTGVSPECPVECPAQFTELGEVPTTQGIDPDGPFPQALEFLYEDLDEDNEDNSDRLGSLFVGGLGSDVLVEIRMDEQGAWTATNTLELADASGIKRIRVSPTVDLSIDLNETSRFIYVIAGDGSTRVVGREYPGQDDTIGFECDTQIDPSVYPDVSLTDSPLGCVPITEVPSDAPPADRRGLARGPGIRPAEGEVTDWMFNKIEIGEEEMTGDVSFRSPFAVENVVAVGVTTRADVIYVAMDHPLVTEAWTPASGRDGVPSDAEDVLDDILDVTLRPHTLWNDPNAQNAAGLPLMEDAEPSRLVPTDSGPTAFLSPALRRIDGPYFFDPELDEGDEDKEWFTEALGLLRDLDGLDNPIYKFNLDSNATVPLYDEHVAKVVARDYRSWFPSQWELQWEGNLVGDRTTGRFACEQPGWNDASCLVSEAGDSRLVDESASFCEAGVLPGDKLVIVGCTEDSNCGEGRRCLRETSAGGDSTGICVPGVVFDDAAVAEGLAPYGAAELRQICANFISDPCGEAHREFTITHAYQDELWLQGMDIPPMSHWTTDAEGNDVEVSGSFLCSDEQPADGCTSDNECVELLSDDLDDNGVISDDERDDRWMCVEGNCRRLCEDGDECLLRRLPGPACFGEFVRYRIDMRNAFRLAGPVSFAGDRVDVTADLECVPTQDPEISQLLTNRIPLPATDDPSDPDWSAIPLCPEGNTILPTDPNPCRIEVPRSDEAPLYHNHAYLGESVSALRFSNPVLSLILDLTSIQGLLEPIPDEEEVVNWPASAAGFVRARIPRGYGEAFRISSGFVPFEDNPGLAGAPLILPVRIVPIPGLNSAYIVDGSGQGGSLNVRGQVIRVELGETVEPDISFDGVR